MSFSQHRKYYTHALGRSDGKLFLGGEQEGLVASGTTPIHGAVNILNKLDNNTLKIGSTSASFFSWVPEVYTQLQALAKVYNDGYVGAQSIVHDVIYSPFYRRGHQYVLYAVSGDWWGGEVPADYPINDAFGKTKLRFVFCPDEPETFLSYTGIEAGDSVIKYQKANQSIIGNHFNHVEREKDYRGTGKNFELVLGINSDETVTVTGISGDNFLLSGTASMSHQKGTRVVSTNTLHPAPSGETGYQQNFQVRIADNQYGQKRFYVAGSGVTGGCHLGGTFTGEGYTFFETPVIDVFRGYTYHFNQHHATNSEEYMMFSYTSGGHHEGADPITGKYEVEQGGSNYCFNNYCHYHCPDEQTFMMPIDANSNKSLTWQTDPIFEYPRIYYYASGTNHVGGTGYFNVMISGDGGK